MAVPSSPRHPEMPTTHVPKLNYRNPLPEDELDRCRRTESRATEGNSHGSESVTTGTIRSSNSRPKIVISPAGKKKSSFLGGFFLKEPTMLALAQVEADLRAKHGEATSERVPHVSSRKMPEHVPKVNSKWDGVPEVLKVREKDDRSSYRTSQNGNSVRSRSTERSNRSLKRESRNTRRMSDVPSYLENWSQQDTPFNRRYYATSIYTTSTESTQDRPATRAVSSWSKTLRSPSGTSLPEITSFFPDEQTGVMRNMTSSGLGPAINSSTAKSNNSTSIGIAVSTSYDDAVSEHDSTPLSTPRELSPITPGFADAYDSMAGRSPYAQSSSSSNRDSRILGLRPVPMGAFLAGEANALTLKETNTAKRTDLPLRRFQPATIDRIGAEPSKRPDSSRKRLGLQASMILRTEAAPWEAQPPEMMAVSSARSSKNRFSTIKTSFK